MSFLNTLLLANLALYLALEVVPVLLRRRPSPLSPSSPPAPALLALRHAARVALITCLTGSALWSGARLWLRLLRHLHAHLDF